MEQLRRWWRDLPAIPAAREIAIVVAGILIAFMLDAWWEQRTSVARERAHLRAMASDFRQNVQRLHHHIEMEESAAKSSRDLLLLARSGSAASPDSIWHLLGRVLTSQRFTPVMGAYEELENSGGLALLRDDSLRTALADFASRLNVRHSERFSDEIFLTFIREFAGEFSFFAPYVAGEHDHALVQRGSERLLPNAKFQEYLALRHIAAGDVATEYRALAQQAQLVLSRLQSEPD